MPPTKTTVVNPLALGRVSKAINLLCDAGGSKELQAQMMQSFLCVALRSPNEIPMLEVEEFSGVSQASTSRNLNILAARGLVTLRVDEEYARRKLVALTSKGALLANRILDALYGD